MHKKKSNQRDGSLLCVGGGYEKIQLDGGVESN